MAEKIKTCAEIGKVIPGESSDHLATFVGGDAVADAYAWREILRRAGLVAGCGWHAMSPNFALVIWS